MKNLKIVLTGGGTGGHIIPNIALLPDLENHFQIFYLGSDGGMEQRLLAPFKNVTFIPIPTVKLVRGSLTKNLCLPARLISAIHHTKKILKEISPNVIFAKGGYVSLPVAIAGTRLNIPVLGHESDFSMGLANKIIARRARVMFTSFRETCIGSNCIYSGSPIRKEVLSPSKQTAQTACHFPSEKPTILFFGGSQGSRSINNFVFENLDHLSAFNIIHFVGRGNSRLINIPTYHQIEYADNIYDFFALADIVVCRAGANSIFELLAMQKLMLLIPLPRTSSRGDQIENARQFKSAGWANVLEEADLIPETFLAAISHLQKNRHYYLQNQKSAPALKANELITKYLLSYAQFNQPPIT